MIFDNKAELNFHNFVINKVEEYINEDRQFEGKILTQNNSSFHVGTLSFGNFTLTVTLYMSVVDAQVYTPTMKIMNAKYDGVQCLSPTIKKIEEMINNELFNKQDTLSIMEPNRLDKITQIISK